MLPRQALVGNQTQNQYHARYNISEKRHPHKVTHIHYYCLSSCVSVLQTITTSALMQNKNSHKQYIYLWIYFSYIRYTMISINISRDLQNTIIIITMKTFLN